MLNYKKEPPGILKLLNKNKRCKNGSFISTLLILLLKICYKKSNLKRWINENSLSQMSAMMIIIFNKDNFFYIYSKKIFHLLHLIILTDFILRYIKNLYYNYKKLIISY